MEPFNLVHQFARFARFARPFVGKGGPDRAMHAVATHDDHIADFAIFDAFVKFLRRAAMPGSADILSPLLWRRTLCPSRTSVLLSTTLQAVPLGVK